MEVEEECCRALFVLLVEGWDILVGLGRDVILWGRGWRMESKSADSEDREGRYGGTRRVVEGEVWGKTFF